MSTEPEELAEIRIVKCTGCQQDMGWDDSPETPVCIECINDALRANNEALRTVIESAIAAYDEASDLPTGAVVMRAILSRGLEKVGAR